MVDRLPFAKYHGLGNDFILIDNRHQDTPLLTPAQAVQWCDRRFGIGADGVIFALPATAVSSKMTPGEGEAEAAWGMRIFNSDGSEPEMCGNGIRCLAQFLGDLGVTSPTLPVQTLAGLITVHRTDSDLITVDMGCPRLTAAEIPTTLASPSDKVLDHPLTVGGQVWPVTCVSMGNPHCVTFVEDLGAIALAEWGPRFEHHPAFPQRINTEFVQVLAPGRLRLQVWERGAGATLACGTGACATLVAAVLTGRATSEAVVELQGGNLEIRWDQTSQRVWMTGPAQRVMTAIADLPFDPPLS